MRILMLNNEYPPLGGGTGSVNQTVLQRLARVPELEIDLITSALGRHVEEARIAEHVRIVKVPVENRNVHHSSNRELLTYASRSLTTALRRHRARPYDACLAWSAVPAGAVALALRRIAGLPYVVRVCGPDIPGFERRYAPLYPMLSPVIRATWRGAEAVIAKCESERAMIHAVDSRVLVRLIPNGVDLDVFRPGEPVPDSGPLRLLSVARIIERKGQQHLLAAEHSLVNAGVDVTLTLVGTGDAESDRRAQAQDLGIEQRVRFEGYVPREQMPRLYAEAHVFVLPSFNEGMSVATLEAMAAGLPLVVTRVGGLAELVEDGNNGLTFTWGDVATLSAHLGRLAEDRPLARRMGVSSRTRAQQFCWETVTDSYMNLFEEIVPTRKLVHAV